MIGAAPGSLLVTQADSARAVATVYAVSLLATVPLVLAALAAFAVRSAGAEARALVWRSAIVALLVVFVGRLLPTHLAAWVVPSALAAPLVALGRVQVTAESLGVLRSLASTHDLSGVEWPAMVLVRALLGVYLAGVAVVLAPTVLSLRRLHRLAAGARPLDDAWPLADVCRALGVRRRVRLLVSPRVRTPATWGVFWPVVVLPQHAMHWNAEARRMVLLHEVAHVRAFDWTFRLAGRVVCALYWFHPGAWWIARGLHDDGELACDDRVIGGGAARSDYAELLVGAADAAHGVAGACEPSGAPALSARRGLRGRLDAVLDVRHDVRPVARAWVVVAAVATVVIALPTSTVQLAPSRDVLTTLMTDARWESRAYAVMGLARRQDSVAVARSAAELDPSPRVRAWARYALGETVQPAQPASAGERVRD